MHKDLTQNLCLKILCDNTGPYSWEVIIRHVLPSLHIGVKTQVVQLSLLC